MKKIKISRKTAERMIYIGIIIALTIYGMMGSETAEPLIRAVKDAFSILITTQ